MYPEHYGSNPLFPSSDDFEVVMKNDHSGMGVVTYRDFNEGELIALLSGNVINDIRQHSLQIEENTHIYDVYFSGYFLHSCEPNVTLDMKNLTVHALKPVQAYDFLYMDYAETEKKLYKQFPCSCGAATCRGWITGNSEVIDENDPYYQSYLQLRKIAV